jgi:hypothetical protein
MLMETYLMVPDKNSNRTLKNECVGQCGTGVRDKRDE